MLARDLRLAGLRVETDLRGTALKRQLRRADKLGARAVIIIGDEEQARGVAQLKDMRAQFADCLRYVLDKRDTSFQDVASKDLVEMYSYLYIGYPLLDEAENNERKVFIANRYIVTA